MHVAWSGNHDARTPSGGPTAGAVLGGGELLLPGEVVLAPGERYRDAASVLAAGPATGSTGSAAGCTGTCAARPAHPRRPRPVVLNTWEAVYFDHDLDRLTRARRRRRRGRRRAVRARRRLVPRTAATTRAGLGDWYVDADVWPRRACDPLVDHVRGLGMEFGLWVEPEMVNPDSDLARAHPDWVLRRRRPAAACRARHQQVLDLAQPGGLRRTCSSGSTRC